MCGDTSIHSVPSCSSINCNGPALFGSSRNGTVSLDRAEIAAGQLKYLSSFEGIFLKRRPLLRRFGVASPAISVFGSRLMLRWWRERHWEDPRYQYPQSLYGRHPMG